MLLPWMCKTIINNNEKQMAKSIPIYKQVIMEVYRLKTSAVTNNENKKRIIT